MLRVGLALACAGMTAFAVIAVPAAAADLRFRESPTLTVSGPSAVEIEGLMPGDVLPPQAIAIWATGAVRYRLRSIVVGSAELARLMTVTIVARRSGALLYRGSLADADIGTGADALLVTDATDVLDIEVVLPVSAGNEVQGTRLTLRWEIEATDVAAA
jgi:hypothetical protein